MEISKLVQRQTILRCMYTLKFGFDKIIQIFLAAIFVWIKFVTYIFNYCISERWILWILIHSNMWHLVFSTDLLKIKYLICSNIKNSIIARNLPPAFYHIWICHEFLETLWSKFLFLPHCPILGHMFFEISNNFDIFDPVFGLWVKNSCSKWRRNHTKMYLSDFQQLLCFDPMTHPPFWQCCSKAHETYYVSKTFEIKQSFMYHIIGSWRQTDFKPLLEFSFKVSFHRIKELLLLVTGKY